MLIFIAIVIFLAAVLFGAVDPKIDNRSDQELEHLKQHGSKEAEEALKDKELWRTFRVVMSMKVIFLYSIFSYLLVCRMDWIGWILSFLGVLVYQYAININILKKLATLIYQKYIKNTFMLKKMNWLRGLGHKDNEIRISSKYALLRLIDQSNSFLSSNEKDVIKKSLQFEGKTVKDIMVKRSDIDFVDRNEFLGPLTLNDLHKKGHKRLPVIAKNIDEIVGILDINNHLSLGVRQSMTAEDAMDHRIFYIRQDSGLMEALSVFVKTHFDFLIVIDKKCKTVGILTIEDVVKEFVGTHQKNDFDDYDSIQSVAKN